MKERPILFSTPMVQAILDGRKTQTRRVIKPQPEAVDLVQHKTIPFNGSPEFLLKNIKCPYGQPGDSVWQKGMIPCSGYYYIKGETDEFPLYLWKVEDEDNPGHYFITWGYNENDDPESIEVEGWHIDTIEWKRPGDVLWVRETWTEEYFTVDHTMREDHQFMYKADQYGERKINWKPSIHMPKIACRIKLKITNIRVERLQDISERDAEAEGVIRIELYKTFVWEYETLWEIINGKGSWDKNPWVWVVEFKRIDAGKS